MQEKKRVKGAKKKVGKKKVLLKNDASPIVSKKKGTKKKLSKKKELENSSIKLIEEEPVTSQELTITHRQKKESSDLEVQAESKIELVETEEEGEIQLREKYMTIGEHLEELRQVLIRGLFVLGVFIIVALFFGEDVHKILTTPYKNVLGKNATFYQIKMMAPFMVYLKTAVMISILFSFPIQLYFIWGFISPAVEPKHERYGKIIILASTLLFWAGIALCWYSVFEKMLQFFLVVFQLPDIETKLPIDEYYDIFFNLHLIFGIAFQLPIVLVLLGAMGILRSAFLFSKWREVTIFLAIASAFLSPPDWVSMVALLIPLEILFFLSLIVMKMVERKEE